MKAIQILKQVIAINETEQQGTFTYCVFDEKPMTFVKIMFGNNAVIMAGELEEDKDYFYTFGSPFNHEYPNAIVKITNKDLCKEELIYIYVIE